MNKKSAPSNFLSRLSVLSKLTIGFAALLFPLLAAGQAAFVQVNSNPPVLVNTNSVAVPFTSAQTAGNLNVVVVGWNDSSATISSVTDTNGNTYNLAAGTLSLPLAAPGDPQDAGSQVIYYAKNIIGGANTVTVTFNQNTAAQSVRVVEYSGLDLTNPLDTSVGATGSATTADSGPVTTNSANDLLFGAGGSTTQFFGAGSGFATRLVNGFGDIVEDQSVTATGTYDATAALTSGKWTMQLVAFRVAGQTPPTFSAPAITSLSAPSSPEAGGLALTITGTNFEPGATVLFDNGAGVTAAGVNCSVTLLVSPNATIDCLTPSFPVGAATITVTNVDGQSSSFAFSFTASTPFATATSPGISPDTGTTNGGTIVVIAGSDFAAGAAVTVGGVPAYNVTVRSSNTVEASVPAGPAATATVVVTNPSGALGTLSGAYTYVSGAGISFVQASSAQPTSPAATATVDFSIAQTAGNLNIVIIGWADVTATVQSVTDTAGNTYTLAFPPTLGTGLSQAVYYAKNINAAASNTVTVTFSVPAISPDVRVLEYSGLDTAAPLDTGDGDAGTSAAPDSGSITTSNSSDLIIGASFGGIAAAPGKNFATLAVTPSGSIVEHHIDQPAGVINANATLSASAPWVMQAVAFAQAPAPDFTIGVTPPSSASVIPGGLATYTISVSGLNGFTGAVTLTCSAGVPPGASCAFVPPSVTAATDPVTSTLTITTSLTTPASPYIVTVTGTSGALTHDTSVTLTVNPPPDFTIAGSALSPASVAAGGSATSTITIAPLNSFTGAVDLTCSIAPVVTPAPTCAFNPASVAGGSGTSTLTLNSSATTPVGLYNVTVHGTSGSLNHTTLLSVTLTAAPDFTIAGSALAPATVSAGGTATSTITVAPLNGFSSAVNLTCSVTPVVARIPTCAFNPASVAGGSGTSTLTVSTTAPTLASLTPHLRPVFYAMWLPIGGLALLGAGLTSRKKWLLCFLFGCLMFSALIFLPACGGGSSSGGGGHPGTPAGAYTVTVTGTSGSTTHTSSLSLTVQ